MKFKSLLFAVPALATLAVSCGGDKPGENISGTDTTQTVPADTAVAADEELAMVLPSPVAVAEIFANAGIDYKPELPNSTANAAKYSTTYKKSLNFGVYTSDLAFCIVSEKNKEASEYLKVIRSLGNEIGLNNVFDNESLLQRFDKNIGVQDSLTDLMIDIRDQVDAYHAQNGDMEKTFVYFTGAWVEGMYLGAVSSGSNAKAGKAMAGQFYMLEDILKGLNKLNESSDDYKAITQSLEDLKATYAGLATVKAAGEDAMYDVTLTADEVKTLSQKVIALRNDITKI